MANYGMYKNSEGYADPTAYNAIMGMAKPGEIYSYRGGECLIVKNQGVYSNILKLCDEGNERYNLIDIAGKYADPGMLSYAYNNALGSCVRKLTPEAWDSVRKEIENALGMSLVKDESEVKCDTAEPVHVCSEREHALNAKLELLQGMYNDLLAKVFAK